MKTVTLAFLLVCTSALASPLETEVLLYNAFSDAPSQMTLVAGESLPGECLTHSQLSPREDAWRCLSGDKLFDPCYVRTFVKRNEVICPNAPWLPTGVILTLGQELPQPAVDINAYQQLPWTITLTNGKHCTLINKEGRTQYDCEGYGLVGNTLHRCKGLWRIIMQSPTASYTQDEQIAKVWY